MPRRLMLRLRPPTYHDAERHHKATRLILILLSPLRGYAMPLRLFADMLLIIDMPLPFSPCCFAATLSCCLLPAFLRRHVCHAIAVYARCYVIYAVTCVYATPCR